MSRSGYSEDYDIFQWDMIRWRGQVASAIRGKRGQAFLKELIEALDAMPDKRLIANNLQNEEGVCAIGSVGLKRGIDMADIDPEDYSNLANIFGIAHQLVQEIEFENDESLYRPTLEKRWERMRAWAVERLKAVP